MLISGKTIETKKTAAAAATLRHCGDHLYLSKTSNITVVPKAKVIAVVFVIINFVSLSFVHTFMPKTLAYHKKVPLNIANTT